MVDVSILVRCVERNEFTDHTLSSIEATATSHFELICQPNAASAAVNSNLLLARASSNRVILMDDDLSFTSRGWDERLLETLDRYPGMGCVSPRIADIEGRLLGPYRYVRPGCVVTGFELWGALLAFQRSTIRYDEVYERTLCDDTDFLLQHLQAGLKLGIDGAVDVIHLRELSRDAEPPWFAKNKAYFTQKWQLQNRHIAWGEYTEWRSPSDYTVGLVEALAPHFELREMAEDDLARDDATSVARPHGGPP
jgi:hypothetical protein